MVVPEEAAMVLMEGVAKGGYPVDITAQSTLDLTSIGQSELACASSLIESGLEPGAAAGQLGAGYAVLDVQEPFDGEQDISACITEVIQPMEMAELADILPTLSRIEEEIPSGPSTSSVIDMLESFGLGIGENTAFFDLGNSDVVNGTESLSHFNFSHKDSSSVMPELNFGEPLCENNVPQGQDTSFPDITISTNHTVTPVFNWNLPPEDAESQQDPSKGNCFPVRSQVEWERPSHSSS